MGGLLEGREVPRDAGRHEYTYRRQYEGLVFHKGVNCAKKRIFHWISPEMYMDPTTLY